MIPLCVFPLTDIPHMFIPPSLWRNLINQLLQGVDPVSWGRLNVKGWFCCLLWRNSLCFRLHIIKSLWLIRFIPGVWLSDSVACSMPKNNIICWLRLFRKAKRDVYRCFLSLFPIITMFLSNREEVKVIGRPFSFCCHFKGKRFSKFHFRLQVQRSLFNSGDIYSLIDAIQSRTQEAIWV